MWFTTAEAREALTIGESALYKRVQRYIAKNPGTPLIERESAGADGGRARYRLHRELVEMWTSEAAPKSVNSAEPGSVDPRDLLEQSARMAEIAETHLELRNRDDRIAHLEERLAAARRQVVEVREEAKRWREMVHRLSAPLDESPGDDR